MKRTIITLIALSGLAMGTDYTGAFSWGSDAATQPLTLSFGKGSGLKVTSITAVMTTEATNPNPDTDDTGTEPNAKKDTPDPLPVATDATYKTTTYQANTFTPGVNIGNGGTWTLSFTLQNETSGTLDIDAISLGIFTFNNGGVSQGNDTNRDLILTLGGDFSGVTEYTHAGNSADGSLTTKALTLTEGVSVATGDSVDFSLNVQEGVSLGTFVGLKSVTFSTPNVPEPTTATLSLLAFAGLVARRRRK